MSVLRDHAAHVVKACVRPDDIYDCDLVVLFIAECRGCNALHFNTQRHNNGDLWSEMLFIESCTGLAPTLKKWLNQ